MQTTTSTQPEPKPELHPNEAIPRHDDEAVEMLGKRVQRAGKPAHVARSVADIYWCRRYEGQSIRDAYVATAVRFDESVKESQR